MEITIDKPHKTEYYFKGEITLDMKYEYILLKEVSASGTIYGVNAQLSKDESDTSDWSETKQKFVENIIRKHYETYGAE
jgi:hypothetical protein